MRNDRDWQKIMLYRKIVNSKRRKLARQIRGFKKASELKSEVKGVNITKVVPKDYKKV